MKVTSTRARSRILPCSSVMVRASVSTFSRIFAAIARSAAPRWTAGRLAHSFCAFSAEATAISTSATLLSGTVQMGAPVEGLKTVTRSLPLEGTNRPSMKLS